MSYRDIVAAQPFMQELYKELYEKMIQNEEMSTVLLDCTTVDAIEDVFDRFGYGSVPISIRTKYLLRIMGKAKSYEDMSAMPAIRNEFAERKEQSLVKV